MRKPVFCICENKGADQLRSNCAADQHLCFHYIDSTTTLPFKSEISTPPYVAVQPFCVGPSQKPDDRFSHDTAQLSADGICILHKSETIISSMS